MCWVWSNSTTGNDSNNDNNDINLPNVTKAMMLKFNPGILIILWEKQFVKVILYLFYILDKNVLTQEAW